MKIPKKRVLGSRTTTKDLPDKYLRVLNGIFKLTDKELELAAALVTKYMHFHKQGLKEPFLSKFVFSTEERRSLCDSLDGISSQNLGNKFKQLVDKKVLSQKDGGYVLDHTLMPTEEITFKFIIDDSFREDVQKSEREDRPEEVPGD